MTKQGLADLVKRASRRPVSDHIDPATMLRRLPYQGPDSDVASRFEAIRKSRLPSLLVVERRSSCCCPGGDKSRRGKAKW